MKVEIENALKTFEDNIIKPTDKSKLQSTINKAKNLYNNSTEGSKDGNFKVGSKATLQNAINEAKRVYDSKTSTQVEIDNEITLLQKAIANFKKSKIILKKPTLSEIQSNKRPSQTLEDLYTPQNIIYGN